MCIAKQPQAPAPQQVIARQGYKSPASRASLASQGATTGEGGDMSSSGLLDASGGGGRVLAGGDQKLMPDLSTQNSVGGSILTDSPAGSGAVRVGGYGSSTKKAAVNIGQRSFSPNISAPWLAKMQAR